MKTVCSYRNRLLMIMVTALALPLSTSTTFKKAEPRLSSIEMYQLLENSADTYIYCDSSRSTMIDIINEISEVDDNKNSAVWQLRRHIEEGFSIGLKDAVVETLEYAGKIAHRSFPASQAAQMQNIINVILNQIDMGQLNVSLQSAFASNNAPTVAPVVVAEESDASKTSLFAQVLEAALVGAVESIEASPETPIIEASIAEEAATILVASEENAAERNKDIEEDDGDVASRGTTYKEKNKVKFYKDVTFKDKASFDHFVGFHGNTHFHKNVEIDGILSAGNEAITCNLTVGCNISMSDSISPAIGNVIKAGAPFIHTYPGIVSDNTFVGENAGNFTMTGTDNSGFGANALSIVTTGAQNTAIGSSAMNNNATGSNSVAVGWNAYSSGDYNVIIGSDSGNNGSYDIAIGYEALYSDETGSNIAIGHQAMQNSTGASYDTAVGYQALQNDQSGFNTAVGYQALNENISGTYNAAFGAYAMEDNISGTFNTASGYGALGDNTIGSVNTAHGALALLDNTEGNANTALGFIAMEDNTTGNANTAIGLGALLRNTTGNANTAIGIRALDHNITGNGNVAIGAHSGTDLITGNNNIYIAAEGAPAESGTLRFGTDLIHVDTYIQGIYGVAVSSGLGVQIDLNGHLGTMPSTRSLKKNIADMDVDSEGVYQLRPVTFSYRSDSNNTKEYGLIAEEVMEVFPSLVAPDRDGNPYSVRYQVLPMLLLNEVQKHQAIIEELAERVAALEERA